MPMSIVSEKSRKHVRVCVQIKNSQRAGQGKTGSKLRSKSFSIFDVGITPRLRLKLALKCHLPLLPRNFSKITQSACFIQFIAYFIIIRETSKIICLSTFVITSKDVSNENSILFITSHSQLLFLYSEITDSQNWRIKTGSPFLQFINKKFYLQVAQH